MNPFYAKLEARWNERKFVCVGLDVDPAQFPEGYEKSSAKDIFRFNKHIVDATKDIVLAYKPNAAFYEAFGSKGVAALEETIEYIRDVAPHVVTILDAKRADIGSTNEGYVKSAFDTMGFDAVTLNPYFGMEAMKPFLERADKGCIFLCRTSNPGADEFQNKILGIQESDFYIYQFVAHRISHFWNTNNNCALVMGATNPKEVAVIRKHYAPELPFLMPGFGKQGGEVRDGVLSGRRNDNKGLICNSSRGIIYAKNEEETYFLRARKATLDFDREILAALGFDL